MDISEKLYDILDNAENSEILAVITMSLLYFTRKTGTSLESTLKIVKKGCKELEKRRGK